MLDGKAFGIEMTDIVKGYVDRATAPLLARIDALEKRQPEKGEKGDKGEPGESIRGEPGIGLAGAFRSHDGLLILTLSDGTTRDVGNVNGRDGMDADMVAIERLVDDLVAEKVAAIPVPKDGKDGFSLIDFDSKLSDDARTMILSFEDETQRYEHEMKFPIPIYRGVFKQGDEYEAGDMVTWGGSLWHCDEKTVEKPDVGHWTLCVKRGRDGKDGKNG